MSNYNPHSNQSSFASTNSPYPPSAYPYPQPPQPPTPSQSYPQYPPSPSPSTMYPNSAPVYNNSYAPPPQYPYHQLQQQQQQQPPPYGPPPPHQYQPYPPRPNFYHSQQLPSYPPYPSQPHQPYPFSYSPYPENPHYPHLQNPNNPIRIPPPSASPYPIGSPAWCHSTAQDARAAFLKADRDASGYLDVQEFVNVIRSLVGELVPYPEALQYFAKCDSDQNGRIGMNEFEKLYVEEIARRRY